MGPMADGTWKVKVAAVPENGKANEELCRILAEYFAVQRDAVEVIAGQTNTRKTVRLPDIAL